MSFFFGPAWTAQTGANSPNRYTSTLPPIFGAAPAALATPPKEAPSCNL
jgi:hypothetical protein